MKKDIFEHNWVFRTSDGLLYGFKFRPRVTTKFDFINKTFDVYAVPGDKAKLIREAGKDYNFIPPNKLLHISDLAKYEFSYETHSEEITEEL